MPSDNLSPKIIADLLQKSRILHSNHFIRINIAAVAPVHPFFRCNHELVLAIIQPRAPPGKGAVRQNVVFTAAHQVQILLSRLLAVSLHRDKFRAAKMLLRPLHIIGKQENLVDYVLRRETVSRLHLRIDRKEDRYYVQDLNSTNGTMAGGHMLENNEIMEIWDGVEISIAGARYRFE